MSDTEDSRAASLGRKRRQNEDVLQSARDAEKRRKLDDNANFVALDSDDNSEYISEDRESGEVSSVASDTHSRNESHAPDPQATASRPQRRDGRPSRGAVKSHGGIPIEAVYPDSFQKFVREQLEQRDDLPTVDSVLIEFSEDGKPYSSLSKEFSREWNQGYAKYLPDINYLDLQLLVQDKDAFRIPLEADATSKLKSKSGRNFGTTVQTACEKEPWKPRAQVVFDLLKLKKSHVVASELLKHHVDANLLPEKDPRSSGPKSNNPIDLTASDIDDPSANATHANGDSNSAIRSNIHLSELSASDLHDQNLYNNLWDPSDLVRCLSCGDRGHMHHACPAHTCTHCGSKSHPSPACRAHHKCARCRARGHIKADCTRPSRMAGGIGDDCDVCGERGHAEEECAAVWLTYKPERDGKNLIPEIEMVVSCYNCGRSSHWGDDCPALPDFVADLVTFDTWSKKNADRYIIGKGEERDEGPVVALQGNGAVPAHQVAMLGEWA